MNGPSNNVITAAALFQHWQGHRGLTRRVIEAFPESDLFTFSIGGMRPFAELAHELLRLAAPALRGLVTGDWTAAPPKPESKAKLLQLWDRSAQEMAQLWPQLPEGRLGEPITAFGQWEAPGYSHVLYWIDNEIHHRGQGYVYLRALGIEPPPFWDRS